MAISFHTRDTNFILRKKSVLRKWINSWIELQGLVSGEINYIFTSNEFLLGINREYLNHNYFTDVITFDYCKGKLVAGDIFISIDQVILNADYYGVSKDEELRRVMIHGILHLMGMKDATDEEKVDMRAGEEDALELYKSLNK